MVASPFVLVCLIRSLRFVEFLLLSWLCWSIHASHDIRIMASFLMHCMHFIHFRERDAGERFRWARGRSRWRVWGVRARGEPRQAAKHDASYLSKFNLLIMLLLWDVFGLLLLYRVAPIAQCITFLITLYHFLVTRSMGSIQLIC